MQLLLDTRSLTLFSRHITKRMVIRKYIPRVQSFVEHLLDCIPSRISVLSRPWNSNEEPICEIFGYINDGLIDTYYGGHGLTASQEIGVGLGAVEGVSLSRKTFRPFAEAFIRKPLTYTEFSVLR